MVISQRRWLACACGLAILLSGAAVAADSRDVRSLKSFRPFSPPLPRGATASPDPRDFEGIYNLSPVEQALRPIEGGDTTAEGDVIPPFTTQGAAIFWQRIETFNQGAQIPEPSVMCEPSWKTRTSSLMQFAQNAQVLVILIAEHHIARLIHMNARHPAHLTPSYMGHSIGHWEGNTLVIDTIGFNNRGWFDFAGTPQSRQTHLVERMSKQSDGSIEDLMTFSDPTLFRHPFTTRDMYRLNSPADGHIDEEICDENERNYELESQ